MPVNEKTNQAGSDTRYGTDRQLARTRYNRKKTGERRDCGGASDPDQVGAGRVQLQYSNCNGKNGPNPRAYGRRNLHHFSVALFVSSAIPANAPTTLAISTGISNSLTFGE